MVTSSDAQRSVYFDMSLTVQRAHEKRVLLYIERNDFREQDEIQPGETPNLITFWFRECSARYLEFWEELTDIGVAHTISWDDHERPAGWQALRFTHDGDITKKKIFNHETVLSVDEMMKELTAHGMQGVAEFIEERAAYIAAPSWDNQTAYGKVFLMKRAVMPIVPVGQAGSP